MAQAAGGVAVSERKPLGVSVSTWPQAVVAVAGIGCFSAGVVLLVRFGVTLDAISAFIATGLFVGQFGIARRANQVAQETASQSDTLDTIAHQVNGPLHRTIATAVEGGVARGIAQATGDQPPPDIVTGR